MKRSARTWAGRSLPIPHLDLTLAIIFLCGTKVCMAWEGSLAAPGGFPGRHSFMPPWENRSSTLLWEALHGGSPSSATWVGLADKGSKPKNLLGYVEACVGSERARQDLQPVLRRATAVGSGSSCRDGLLRTYCEIVARQIFPHAQAAVACPRPGGGPDSEEVLSKVIDVDVDGRGQAAQAHGHGGNFSLDATQHRGSSGQLEGDRERITTELRTTPFAARLCFLIILRGSELRVGRRLLEKLWRPEHAVVFYAEAPAALVLERESLLLGRKNLRFIRHEGPFVRGAPHILWAALRALRRALADFPGWDFALLLSGSHYPIRPVEFVAEYLGLRQGLSFIDAVSLKPGGKEGEGYPPWFSPPDFGHLCQKEGLYFDLCRDEEIGGSISPSEVAPHPVLSEGGLLVGRPYWVLHRHAAVAVAGEAARPLIEALEVRASPDELAPHTVLGSLPKSCGQVAFSDLTVTFGLAEASETPDSEFAFRSVATATAKDFPAIVNLVQARRFAASFVRKVPNDEAGDELRDLLDDFVEEQKAVPGPFGGWRRVSLGPLSLRLIELFAPNSSGIRAVRRRVDVGRLLRGGRLRFELNDGKTFEFRERVGLPRPLGRLAMLRVGQIWNYREEDLEMFGLIRMQEASEVENTLPLVIAAHWAPSAPIQNSSSSSRARSFRVLLLSPSTGRGQVVPDALVEPSKELLEKTEETDQASAGGLQQQIRVTVLRTRLRDLPPGLCVAALEELLEVEDESETKPDLTGFSPSRIVAQLPFVFYHDPNDITKEMVEKVMEVHEVVQDFP